MIYNRHMRKTDGHNGWNVLVNSSKDKEINLYEPIYNDCHLLSLDKFSTRPEVWATQWESNSLTMVC